MADMEKYERYEPPLKGLCAGSVTQNPKGEQYSDERCSDQQASIHFVPSHCYAPPSLMRFESVTIAAGEKARCKSRPRMNRREQAD